MPTRQTASHVRSRSKPATRRKPRADHATILTLNVNYEKGKGGTRMNAARYAAYRKAILRAVPRGERGILFTDLPAAVETALPRGMGKSMGSVMWNVTTVKLDLEARGLIERVPGSKPQRIRRV